MAISFVFVLLAAFITLKIIFPTDKLQAMAQQYAQNYLHREVSFSKVSFALIGVTVHNLAISEASTFEQGTFLKADHATIKVALLPLLRKQIQISTVGVKGLQVHTIRQADGSFNFDDLLNLANDPSHDPSEDKQEDSSDGMMFSLLADYIYAKNCYLSYEDLLNKLEGDISISSVEIRDFDLAAPFNVKLQFNAHYKDAEREISLPLTSNLTIDLANLNHEKAYVTLQNLITDYKAIKVEMKGGIKNFNHPVVNLQGNIRGISSDALAEIAADLPHFELPAISFQIDAQADLDASTARLTQSKFTLGNSYLSAIGQTGWGGKATTYNATANLNLNLTELAKMTQLLDGYSMGGAITGQLTATDKKDGQDIRGTIAIKEVTVQYPPVLLSALKGDIVLASLGDISSKNITGQLNGEPFTTSFAYKDLGNVLDIVLNADLSKLTLQDFGSFSESSQEDTTAGTDNLSAPATEGPETLFNVKANIKIGPISVPHFSSQGATLTANLKKASASMKQANGTVSFVLQEGAITDLFSFIHTNKVVKLILLPLALVNKVTSKLGVDIFPAKSEQDKGKIKISEGTGTYVFTNGVMNLQETHLNSAVSDITATGNINFLTEKLDMRVKASVLTSQTPIVLKIGGTINEPSGGLDVTRTAVSLVTGIVNYKTPGKVATSAVGTATHTTKSVANTGVDAVKGTVHTATGTVKAIGNLFKSKSTEKETDK